MSPFVFSSQGGDCSGLSGCCSMNRALMPDNDCLTLSCLWVSAVLSVSKSLRDEVEGEGIGCILISVGSADLFFLGKYLWLAICPPLQNLCNVSNVKTEMYVKTHEKLKSGSVLKRKKYCFSLFPSSSSTVYFKIWTTDDSNAPSFAEWDYMPVLFYSIDKALWHFSKHDFPIFPHKILQIESNTNLRVSFLA